ncbi:MAG TPA: hypothetical protein VFX14_01215 [Methylomirabilota bacterium]|nr:hypothetical protein [Methylomirabilota bacterium]
MAWTPTAPVPVGTLGAGIEYFLADGLAVGAEVKYLFAGDQTLRIHNVEHSHSIASLFTAFGVRMFYPERPTAPPIDPAGGRMRLYRVLRVGAAAVTDRTCRITSRSSRSRPLSGPSTSTSAGPWASTSPLTWAWSWPSRATRPSTS